MTSVDVGALIRLDKVAADFVMPFNHRVVGGAILITNDIGDQRWRRGFVERRASWHTARRCTPSC